ncbi:AarF/UbiB family protein [Roseimicrobium sp. ORNL1]|uniref:ABC1 kinase family protein n=1 Tax=Roseimicrobium sp. ORNL1 TaxID=2711231 RepID=UPI0013E0F7C4|nr:AarF/UbiB family protein [Roseimicrobium sp. ORNL1]QIF01237.1 AarF/ABC1/UbiB kinase family protein [Roseimicrobium sp. ORNL1]
MPATTLSLRPSHLKRYHTLIRLLAKYGLSDLVKNAPLIDDPLPQQPIQLVPAKATELARDLEVLGPAFIKLGQLLSTRADFIAPVYADALSRLQNQVEPFPFEQVEAIVSVELGVRLSKAFAEFDSTPIAAASLGQVHRAVLRNGQVVAVKVQRPGVRESIAEDLEVFAEVAGFLDAHTELGRRYEFSKIVEQLRISLIHELDYRQEAENLKLMRKQLEEFKLIVIPAPVDHYTSGRVLTMDHISGQKVTSLSGLTQMDIDGPALAEEFFRAYLHQILNVGLFHADPHPGNVFVTNDHRIALIDLGMVARIGPQMQDHLIKLLLAISEGQSERAAEVAERMGTPKDTFKAAAFRERIGALVSEQYSASLNRILVGRVVVQVAQISAETGLSVPGELTMLGKTLLNLDRVGMALWPEFSPNESIRRNVADIMHRKTLQSLSPANLLGTAMEAKELLERLPSRLNAILTHLAENRLRVDLRAVDEGEFISGLQKIANRITQGLIFAGLTVSAALMMRVDTGFKIFGYSGLAFLFFIIAAIGAMWVAIEIMLHDRRPRK